MSALCGGALTSMVSSSGSGFWLHGHPCVEHEHPLTTAGTVDPIRELVGERHSEWVFSPLSVEAADAEPLVLIHSGIGVLLIVAGTTHDAVRKAQIFGFLAEIAHGMTSVPSAEET